MRKTRKVCYKNISWRSCPAAVRKMFFRRPYEVARYELPFVIEYNGLYYTFWAFDLPVEVSR